MSLAIQMAAGMLKSLMQCGHQSTLKRNPKLSTEHENYAKKKAQSLSSMGRTERFKNPIAMATILTRPEISKNERPLDDRILPYASFHSYKVQI